MVKYHSTFRSPSYLSHDRFRIEHRAAAGNQRTAPPAATSDQHTLLLSTGTIPKPQQPPPSRRNESAGHDPHPLPFPRKSWWTLHLNRCREHRLVELTLPGLFNLDCQSAGHTSGRDGHTNTREDWNVQEGDLDNALTDGRFRKRSMPRRVLDLATLHVARTT